MNDTEVDVLIREEIAEWEALKKVLEAHPEESLHDPTSPEWTSRDVYAHIIRWWQYSIDSIEILLKGEQLSSLEGTEEEINSRWQQEDRGMGLVEARTLAQSTFERWLRTIRSISTDQWDEQLEEMVQMDGAEHYREHRSYIIAGNI
ncbi:MAG: DinB family protein [Dehalococcoidales bacterium]